MFHRATFTHDSKLRASGFKKIILGIGQTLEAHGRTTAERRLILKVARGRGIRGRS